MISMAWLLENATYSVIVAVSVRTSQDLKLACMLQWKVWRCHCGGLRSTVRGFLLRLVQTSTPEAPVRTDISRKPDEPEGTICSFNKSEGSLDLFKSLVSVDEESAEALKCLICELRSV